MAKVDEKFYCWGDKKKPRAPKQRDCVIDSWATWFNYVDNTNKPVNIGIRFNLSYKREDGYNESIEVSLTNEEFEELDAKRRSFNARYKE